MTEADWKAVLVGTVDHLAAGSPDAVITAVVTEGHKLRLRAFSTPEHLVLAAMSMVDEARDLVGRAPVAEGENRGARLAALAVARHALGQVIGERR